MGRADLSLGNVKLYFFICIFGAIVLGYSNCGEGFGGKISNSSNPTSEFPVDGSIAQNAQGVVWVSATDLVFDSKRSLLYVVDNAQRAIFKLEPGSGDRQVLSSNAVGTGPQWAAPVRMVIAADGDHAYVGDTGNQQIFRVNLDSGNRQLISGPNLGSGPDLERIRRLAINPVTATLYVLERINQAIIAVDLSNGDRSVVSSATRGSGTAFSSPVDLEINADGTLGYVVDRGGVIQVDLATGDRTLLSNATTGSGPTVSFGDIEINPAQNVLETLDRINGSVVVDLNSGNRTASNLNQGVGALWTCFELASNGTTLYALNNEEGSILSINLDSGNVQTITRVNIGSGPPIKELSRMWIHPDGKNAIIAAPDLSSLPNAPEIRLMSLDLETGDREVISGTGVGSGAAIGTNTSILIVTPDLQNLYATDVINNAVKAVNLQTGNRSVISDSTTGSGPTLSFPRTLTMSEAQDFFYTADDMGDQIYKVDRVSGNRTVLSSDTIGSGPALQSIRSLAILANNDALVVQGSENVNQPVQVLRVDGQNGNRSLVTSDTMGSGPLPVNPLMARLKDGNTLYVLDGESAPALYEINVSNGNRSVVVRLDQIPGMNIQYPWDFHVNDDGTLYLIELVASIFLKIDISSGQYRIIAK